MPLVNMKDMLGHAYGHNYAVGAFEVISLEFLQGVMAAAERCRAPVILSLGCPLHQQGADFDLLATAAKCAAQRASVPVVMHVHDCRDVESAVNAMNAGCNGVMIDASQRGLGDNLQVTAKVVGMARQCGVPVEGKLGYAPDAQVGDADTDPGRVAYTAVAEARGYVDRTGVDFLAVSVVMPTAGAKARPKFNWQRLKQINEVLGLPLAVCGDPALSHSHYARLIAYGVAKINYYAGLAEIAFDQLRSSTKGGTPNGYAAAMGDVRTAVEQEADRCLRLWGAAGRAAEVLGQCRRWAPEERAFHRDPAVRDDNEFESAVDDEESISGRTFRGPRGPVRHSAARRP